MNTSYCNGNELMRLGQVLGFSHERIKSTLAHPAKDELLGMAWRSMELLSKDLLKERLAQFEHDLKFLQESGGRILTPQSEDWPFKESLEARDSPAFLTIVGEFPDKRALGVVGSRTASPAAHSACVDLVRFWAERTDGCVVSGGALGIDSCAHRTSLELGIKTIVIAGSGLANPWPAKNRRLFEQIASRGCLLSEFPPSFRARKWSFVQRNRLIARLADPLCIIEPRLKSGAMHTANFGLKDRRNVFVLPVSIEQDNLAAHDRLKEAGACTLSTLDDLLSDGDRPPEAKKENSLFDSQKRMMVLPHPDPELGGLLDLLGKQAIHFDEIRLRWNMASDECCEKLLDFELDGWVEEIHSGLFRRLRGSV